VTHQKHVWQLRKHTHRTFTCQNIQPNFTKFAYGRGSVSSGGVTIRYVLPVL